MTLREIGEKYRIDEYEHDLQRDPNWNALKESEYEEAWKEIWPDKTGNWKVDWESLPLAGL